MAAEIKFYSTPGADRTLRIVRRSDFYIYNKTANAMQASPAWADTLIVTAEDTGVAEGAFKNSNTLTGLPAGSYDILIYDGSAPTIGDTPLTAFTWDYDGSNEITLQSLVAGILSGTIEGSLTLKSVLRLLLAVTAGKASGGGTTTITYRNQADDKDRVVATVDSNGNRTNVVLDAAD